MDQTTSIVLADADASARTSWRMMLQCIAGVTVIAEAGDGLEALALAIEFQPDVVLMASAMPRLDGADAARRIRAEAPGVGVIVLAPEASRDHIDGALRAGAHGFLMKTTTARELAAALEAVGAGRRFVCVAVEDATGPPSSPACWSPRSASAPRWSPTPSSRVAARDTSRWFGR